MKQTYLILASLAILCAGCGNGGSGSGSSTPASNTISATNGSVVAIDCKRERAYVPLPATSGDAEVAVLNLAVNPDKTDPRIATIDLGHIGLARAAAVAPAQKFALVISGSALGTGYLDIINEGNNTPIAGSPFLFPTGSRPLDTDGIVFDPLNKSALVSMAGTALTCPGFVASACTGMALFSLDTKSFGPLIQFDDPVDNVAFDPVTQIALAPSDSIDPTIRAVDAESAIPCTLSDGSLTTLNGDPDGVAVDPNTGIWVVGNYESAQATVINLGGASFNGTPPSCTLDEAGTPPNSVNYDTGTGVSMPGVAINPKTHQAVLTGAQTAQVALLTLPSAPVQQLSGSAISGVSATIPTEPDGLSFDATDFPYGDSIDVCHNRVYILNDTGTFLAEIDLEKLENNPAAISATLPVGNCAGTSTTLGCDNHEGVRFFPLPGV